MEIASPIVFLKVIPLSLTSHTIWGTTLTAQTLWNDFKFLFKFLFREALQFETQQVISYAEV